MSDEQPVVSLSFPVSREPVARALLDRLRREYDTIRIEPTSFAELAESGYAGPGQADLCLVLFDASGFDSRLATALGQRGASAEVWALPISLDAAVARPPDPLAALHAGTFATGSDAEADVIVRRVGALLGLLLLGGKSQLFLSYRVRDGETVAQQLYEHLRSRGILAWKDTADDEYGVPNVDLGEPIQQRIRQHLEPATLVVLLDTPTVLESEWIRREVEMSVRGCVPLLPIVFSTDRSRPAPRFRSLLDLRRWVVLPWEAGTGAAVRRLSEPELADVTGAIERHLMELVRYRLLLPSRAQRAFGAAGFDWSVVEQRRRLYASVRSARFETRVLSHCSLQGPEFAPGLRAFRDYADERGVGYHRRAFIYGTTKLDEPSVSEASRRAAVDGDRLDILHLSELTDYVKEI